MWSCCTSYNEAKEEVVGDSAGTDERFEPSRSPLELRVRVSAAAVFNGSRELHCACEVPGRDGSRVEGTVPADMPAQEAFEASMPSYIPGEALCFSLSTESGSTIGEATLQPSAFYPSGFSGEIAMLADGKAAAYLLVSVTAEDGLSFPMLPATAAGYRATIEAAEGSAGEGLDLDLMDRMHARVNGIREGPVKAYNERAGPLQRVQVDDFVYSVNSLRSPELVSQIKRQRLQLLVRRPLKFSVAVAKRNGTLGLDLWYEHNSSPALLVTKVNDGPVSQWNAENPRRRLECFDRIVGVNGRTGTASQLLQFIRDSPDQVELNTVRARPEDPGGAPVDVESLTRMGAHEQGLLPQPVAPRHHAALLQVYVRGEAFGGVDKSSSGHRFDSVSLANGFIENGVSCQLLHYVHQEHEQLFELCSRFDAVVVRCTLSQVRADGGDPVRFQEGLAQLRKRSVHVWPAPGAAGAPSSKEALARLAGLPLGLEDTAAYASEAELAEGLRRTLASGPRVLKPSGGAMGEGVWVVRLQSGQYREAGGEPLDDGEALTLVEASDGHEEAHTLAELLEFCGQGRGEKAGDWASKGAGGYLQAGPLVDQRFCPRAAEGVVSFQMVGENCVGIVHKKPREGGVSTCAGAGATYTYYGPDDERFADLAISFLQRDWPKVLPSLGMSTDEQPIPLWWTGDCMPASPVGTKPSEEQWVLCDINCCPGMTKCLAACCAQDSPTAGYADISAEDRLEARRLGIAIGERALAVLKKA